MLPLIPLDDNVSYRQKRDDKILVMRWFSHFHLCSDSVNYWIFLIFIYTKYIVFTNNE